MACWQSTYIKVLRVLINDLSQEPTYTDSRLEDIMVVAAKQVQQEINLDTAYTITISPPDITPCPLEDEAFMNFVTLKAACIMDRGALRLAAAIHGIEARCGPAIMRTAKRMDGFATLIDKGYCYAYDEARLQHGFGNVGFCKSILSPFINDTFYPVRDLKLTRQTHTYNNVHQHRI